MVFKKGHKTNLDRVYSQQTLKKLSEKKIGSKNPSYGKTQENHPAWKGDDIGYVGVHDWVRTWRGVPDTCEKCGKIGLKGQAIHWANVDHKYRRVLDDYIRLCAKCHFDYDLNLSSKTQLNGNSE